MRKYNIGDAAQRVVYNWPFAALAALDDNRPEEINIAD
jgi:hypothetical protein